MVEIHPGYWRIRSTNSAKARQRDTRREVELRREKKRSEREEMNRKPATKAEIQKCVAASQQIPPPNLPKEKKISQAKKAIQEAAMYEVNKQSDSRTNDKTHEKINERINDDYETSKVLGKDNRAADEEKKAVEALNGWGGGDDDDDDDF